MGSLQTARAEIDGYHSAWFQDASNITESVDAAIKALRIYNRQIFGGNIAAEDVSTYFKRNVSVPFLDQLLTKLSAHFSHEKLHCNSRNFDSAYNHAEAVRVSCW